MSTQRETAPIGQGRDGEGKVESLTSYVMRHGLVKTPAPVQVTTKRGDPNVIRETYFFLNGERQKLRILFGDGLEAIYDGFWLRCKAEEVAE